MFAVDQYQLLDFGGGRKLERFGSIVLDRPSPAAVNRRCVEGLWGRADARFVASSDTATGCGQRGRWEPPAALPDHWTIEHAPLCLELRPTEFGHLGIFPEQADNWDWIGEQVRQSGTNGATERPRVLNLFAYTGGSTLAAAAAGAQVVHVDASKSTVVWARRNAELSGLAAAPIRWIVEDAVRFAAREVRRGSRYHGIVLDPPTYGHGPKGAVWQLDRDLRALLADCSALLVENASFVLLTCHSPAVTAIALKRLLLDAIPLARAGQTQASDLFLTTAAGRRLHSGVMARWARR